MRIDLHTHSTASDGTQSPAALVLEAAHLRPRLDVLGLTDHDTTSGWDEAEAAACEHGVTLVRGVEISCEREGHSIHLLGYLIDPTFEPLIAELALARESRVTRLERMVELLVADGIPISYAAVLAHVPPGATPGRPHLADALVTTGLVPNRDEAFARWLYNDSPYYVAHYAPDPARAVELVLMAGGVPVIAHPYAVRKGLVPVPGLIEELAALGLAGVEVDHPDHSAEARRELRSLTAALGLFATGSSDYHGAGKRNWLAEETTAREVFEEIAHLGTGVGVVRP
ncbi:MAG: PHP domain-containing protein [Dermatophilaceae bacterium]|nr:PHP domain-containing protein [Actinomycetales bacterium]